MPVCGDDGAAKAAVMALVRAIGYDPEDYGPLSQASAIEDIPFRFFPEWKTGFIIASVVWLIAFVVTLLRWVWTMSVEYRKYISADLKVLKF